MLQVPSLLSRFPMVRTSSLDEALDVFGRMSTPIVAERSRKAAPFGWAVNMTSLGPFDISAHAYGGAFSARTDAVGGIYSFSIPLGAAASEAVAGREVIALERGRSGYLASPEIPGRMHIPEAHQSLQVMIRRSELQTALAGLVGEASNRPLQFHPHLALDHGAGASIQRLALFLAEEAGREANPLASPLVAARLADSLLFTLLLGQPHDHMHAIAGASREAEPRHVRIAAEYLEANAARPVRIAELAAVTGMSVRSLQLAFRKHRGCTPMQFLLERRLVRARAMLLVRSTTTVSVIALDNGFEHLGRFSALYRARFGETPSETRARAR